MTFAIVLLALVLLMLAAYRGYSVILFAPVAALLAVLLTDPAAVPSVFTGLFMERMVGFLKLYFPVFLLGAVFGKLIELSGFSQSIASAVIKLIGQERAAHVRRRITFRCRVRRLSIRCGNVSPGRYSQAPHPGHDCARCVHVHDGCAARDAADPKHHSHDVLRH
jgi:hypothetical protein